jgi:putative Holliday junction resolvase
MKGRILAIDYGTKKIGTALSNEERTMSFPDEKIMITDMDDAVEKILNKIKETEVSMLLIGLPLDENFEETKTSRIIREFIARIKNEISIPIETWNEILTTHMAYQVTSNAKHLRKNLDSQAAHIILQEYLDNQTL